MLADLPVKRAYRPRLAEVLVSPRSGKHRYAGRWSARQDTLFVLTGRPASGIPSGDRPGRCQGRTHPPPETAALPVSLSEGGPAGGVCLFYLVNRAFVGSARGLRRAPKASASAGPQRRCAPERRLDPCRESSRPSAPALIPVESKRSPGTCSGDLRRWA